MADKKVSELTALNAVSGDDLLLVVNDPSGTPTSRKISVNNLFGNVVVNTTHKARTTFTSNVSITGTTVTSTANVAITGGFSVNSTAILPAIQDRMQVANTQSLVNDRIQVANATLLINDRVQVANLANHPTIDGPTLTGITSTTTLQCNTVTIAANTGLRLYAGGITDNVPATSNAATEGIQSGTIWYSNNHLYIAVDGITIKRVALSTF